MTVVRQATTNTMGHSATSPVSAAGFVIDNAGVDRCAFAVIAYDSAAGMAVTAVSYGGVAMTSCGAPAHHATSNAYVEWWYLVNPPTGSNTLAITVSGTVTDIYYNVIGRQNVNQTTPVRAGTYQATTGASANPSQTVSSNTNDLTVTGLNSGGSSITASNQTLDGVPNTNGAYAGASDGATTAAASVTHTWTQGSATNYAMVGFSINGDPTGGGTTGPNGDRWALEGGAGMWLLEAAAGAWLLEQASGAVAKTLPMLTMVAQAAVSLVGSFARAIPMVTMVAAASVDVGGTAARSMPMLTVAPMQATVAIGGTIAKPVPMLTLAAQATVDLAGSIPARAMPMLTLAGVGTVPITGTHTPVIPMQTMAAQATLPITGTVAKSVPMVTLASAGTLGIITSSATLTGLMPMATMVSAGASTITGALARAFPMVLLAAQGTAAQPVVNTNGTVTLTMPMMLGDLNGTALFPVVNLPLGATRFVFDPSRMTMRLDASRTSVTLDPSRRRARPT